MGRGWGGSSGTFLGWERRGAGLGGLGDGMGLRGFGWGCMTAVRLDSVFDVGVSHSLCFQTASSYASIY